MHNHTTPQPINILSPIAKMPFGKHKGTFIYQIPMGSLEWMRRNFNISKTTDRILSQASEMGIHMKEFAVLRKYSEHKYLVNLQSIHKFKKDAEAACTKTEVHEDFVYQMVEPTE